MRTNKILLYTLAAILLLWIIPWIGDFFTSQAIKMPFTLYSSETGDFCYNTVDEKGKMIRTDRQGNIYTQTEFDSLLPYFYYRDLVSQGKFPLVKKGMELSVREVQSDNFVFRSTPSGINKKMIPLYPLLESMSGRADLETPGDVFRIADRIEFTDITKNEIDTEKSVLFNQLFEKKGFAFPAQVIAGNPTTRKEYDEGYLITDQKERLFHFKQVKGKPYLREIEIPANVRITHLFVTEFKNRKTLGFYTDQNDNLYALMNKSYDSRKIEIPPVDLRNESLTIIGNIFDWTIKITKEDGDHIHAVDGESFSALGTIMHPYPEPTTGRYWVDKLIPLKLHFLSGKDSRVFPRIN